MIGSCFADSNFPFIFLKMLRPSPPFFSYFLNYPFLFFSVPTLLSSSKIQYF